MNRRSPFPMRRVLLLLLPSVVLAAPAPVWRPFSPDSPWNLRIPEGAAPDRDSAALIDDLASRGPWRVNIHDWSIPVYFVDAATTPKHDVGDSRPGVYGAGFGFPRSIPIPADAVASPPVGPESDNHLSIVDRQLGVEWGMWAARRDRDGRWFTGLGAVTDLQGTGVAPPWFSSPREFDAHRARASGFPLVAGLIFVDEIRTGRIDHALCFAYDHCRSGLFVPPASTSQVTQLEAIDSRGIPMGGRIQLDPAWDVEHSALSPAGKVIARALQEYGAYCGDYAGANVLYAENSPAAVAAWQGLLSEEDLAQVFTPDFIRRHFRVLDLGNLLPGQNLHRPPPYLLEFSVNGRPARIDQWERTIELADTAAPAVLRWRTIPRLGRLRVGDQFLKSDHAVPVPAAGATVEVVTPDGARSAWRVVPRRD